MTDDDATRPIETPPQSPVEPAAAPPAPAAATAATEPAMAADATMAGAPVPGSQTPGAGAGRGRWIVAGVVAIAAIAVAIGAVVLFGEQSSPVALQYLPGDAAVVAEVRLDLPGDQLQKVGNLLAHFPGFADQSTLGTKLDEALSKLVESASDGKASYVNDLKPWVNGPLFLAALNPGDASSTDGPRDMVVSATTNGGAACANVFKDQAVTHEAYRNLDLVLSAKGDVACVLDGRQALLGDPATVRKALDAKAAGSGMDKSAKYKAARAALGGDRLATFYMDGDSLAKLMPAASAMPIPAQLQGLIGTIPSWFIGGVRAEDDAFVVDFVAAPTPTPTAGPSLLAMPATHASVIAPMLPGDTLVYVEAQGAGVALQNLLTQLREVPDLQSALQMLDGVGGAGALVGWVDDIGLAVSVHGQAPDGALILVAKDEAGAASRVAQLKGLLGLVGAGAGIEVKDSTINGVTVTTITINDAGTLVPPGTVPGGAGLPSGPISFSMAAHGKTVLVTSGEAAMTAILNTAAGSSLADNAAFKHAGTRGIADARMTIYVGVGASVDLAKGFIPPDTLASYQRDVAPYVEPLEGFLIQAASDVAGNRSRMVITVTTK
jgi:hypothetical protein